MEKQECPVLSAFHMGHRIQASITGSHFRQEHLAAELLSDQWPGNSQRHTEDLSYEDRAGTLKPG